MLIQRLSLSIYVVVFFSSLVQVYRVHVAMDERMGFISYIIVKIICYLIFLNMVFKIQRWFMINNWSTI